MNDKISEMLVKILRSLLGGQLADWENKKIKWSKEVLVWMNELFFTLGNSTVF